MFGGLVFLGLGSNDGNAEVGSVLRSYIYSW